MASYSRKQLAALGMRERRGTLRSAIQKAVRRGLPDLAVRVAAELIEEGIGASAATNLLLFAVEDMCVSVPALLPTLVHEVQAIKKAARGICRTLRASDPDLCLRILRLVRWVADPVWPRCRDLALAANFSLRSLELGNTTGGEDGVTVLVELMQNHDTRWVFDEAAWKAEAKKLLKGTVYGQSFALLPSRLTILAYYCDQSGYLPAASQISSIPLPASINWDWATLDSSPLVVPDFCLDKHTRPGKRMGRGLEHFLEHGAVVVNGARVWKLRSVADMGLEHYYQMDALQLKGGAGSRGIKSRMTWKEKGKKRKLVLTDDDDDEDEKVNTQPKRPKVDLQVRMQDRLEPLMPAYLRVGHKQWLQKVCSESKVPTIVYKNKVYKGPLPVNWPHKQRITDRVSALSRLGGGYLPRGGWEILENAEGTELRLWWVSDYVADVTNPFDAASQPLEAIHDDATFISRLVVAGVTKLLVGLGDLCPRNMPWSPSHRDWVLLDYGDDNHSMPDFEKCSLGAFCFSPWYRRMNAPRKARLLSLLHKHKRAITSGLRQLLHSCTSTEAADLVVIMKRFA